MENLTKNFGDNIAVDNLTLSIEKGEILGLLGPNGAGKTTTINIITSILKPTKGNVEIFGKSLYKYGSEIKARMGIVPQYISLYENLTVEENISFLGYRENINELIKISDIGILLSYREGLPKSIMEFMSHGKKVIGTNIRGIRDLIENESIGKLVEVGDYEATARAIEEYYLEGDRSFNTPKEIEKYDLNNVISELEYIYDTLDLQDYYLPEKNINL